MEIPVDYALQNTYLNASGANLSQSSGDQSCHGEPTDEEALYEAKYRHLMEYYEHIYGMNNKLRHRIYHVKKEINHLKQLKRLLCERLLLRRVEIIDTNLEIPDNDSTTVNSNTNALMDKSAAGETPQVQQQQLQQQGGTSANRKRKRAGNSEDPGKQKGNNNTKNQARDEAKRNIISIIESIVADTHKDRAKQQKRQQQQQQPNEAAPSQIPSTANIAATMADASAPSSSSTNCGISSNSNYEPLSESDLSSEELAERLIHRRSSIDHLLPEQPDYEQQQQQDTNNKLWTASTTATSVVEQKVEDDEHKQRMDGITEEAQSTTSIAADQPFDPVLSMGANQ